MSIPPDERTSAELRRHMREFHPRLSVPMRQALAAREHAADHHKFAPRNHRHDGPNRGPSDRPPGWRTGGDVIDLRDRDQARERALGTLQAQGKLDSNWAQM